LYVIELMLHISPAVFCDCFIIVTNAQTPHFYKATIWQYHDSELEDQMVTY